MKKYFVISALTLAFTSAKAQNVTNYTFTATAGAYTQLQGTAGSTSPALSGGTLDDGYFNSIPIGFPFTYESITYTTLSASTNGWFLLGGTLSSSGFTNNLNTGTPRPMVAPLWDDLALAAAGNLTYYTSGSYPNRIFTIEWLNTKWNYLQAAAGISFQVKLYESDKKIEFIYRQDAGAIASCSASVGIGGVTSGQFLSLNGTGAAPTASSVTETTSLNAKPASGQIYRFSKPVTIPTITNISTYRANINTSVVITGTNFDPNPLYDYVYFGSVKASITSASATSLTVTVPTGSIYAPISVTTVANFLTATYTGQNFDITFGCSGASSTMTGWSYDPGTNFASGSGNYRSVMGDFDGDGKTDLAVIGVNVVSVYRNTATVGSINASSFAAKVDFAVDIDPEWIAAGDLDGDGRLDLAVSCYSISVVSVLRNTATAGVINASSFASYFDLTVTGSRTNAVAIGDLDLDGKPEIAVAEEGSMATEGIHIFRNISVPGSLSTASFAAQFIATEGNNGYRPWDLCIADMDGDRKPELVEMYNAFGYFGVYRNISTIGSLSAASFAAEVVMPTVQYRPWSMKLADLNNDGKLDVVMLDGIGNTFLSTISIFQNTSVAGSISFGPEEYDDTQFVCRDINAVDYDGDGDEDLLFTNPWNNSFSYFENLFGTGNITVAWFNGGIYYTNPGNNIPWYVTSGDVDGDGKPDVVTTDEAGGNISAFRNNTSSFTAIAPSTVLNSTSYCYDGSWKVFLDPANEHRALFAVQQGNVNLGTVTVNEYEDGAVGTYNTVKYLARHFKITPAVQPSSPIRIRLFFTAAELSALMAADPTVTGINSLNVTKYDGPTEDGTYYPNDATSLTAYSSASMTTGTMYGGDYLEFQISSFSEFWIHGQSGVLPIHLLNFDAAANEDHVDLNWSTASETNNQYFTIEKTQDGTTFEMVDVMEGAGNSTSENDYSTIDANPYPGTSYYRLKQTDFNGHATYSELRPVTFDGGSQIFSVYPNPTAGTFHLKCPSSGDENLTLEIFDISGKLILSKYGSSADLDRESLELAEGVYSVVLSTSAMKYHQSLIVTH